MERWVSESTRLVYSMWRDKCRDENLAGECEEVVLRMFFGGSGEENCFYVSEIAKPRKTYDYFLDTLPGSFPRLFCGGARPAGEKKGKSLNGILFVGR